MCDPAFQPKPRFRSRAFSTPQRFPGKSELGSLVSCRRRSWATSPPTERSPHSKPAPLSRHGCSLAVIHSLARCDARGLITRRFCERPLARLPTSPPNYGSPFPLPGRSHVTFPAHLDPARRDHPDPRASPASKPYSCCESVPTRASRLAHAGRCSPGVAPLQSVLHHRLESSAPPPAVRPAPRRAPTASRAARLRPANGSSATRPRGWFPAARWTPPRSKLRLAALGGTPAPVRTGPRRLSTAPLLPWRCPRRASSPRRPAEP